MKVLRVEPKKAPKTIDIENTLEAFQEQVGGYIEVVHIMPGIVIVCNEEGKILNFPENRTIISIYDDAPADWDIICGDFIICGVDGEDFLELTAKETAAVKELFKDKTVFIRGRRRTL